MNKSQLTRLVSTEISRAPALDMHTHLFSPAFGTPSGASSLLYGIDEMLTYHYVVAEALIAAPTATAGPMPPGRFWAMPKTDQADYVWDTLFVKSTPLSEATRGVVTTLTALGFDPRKTTLAKLRRYFASQKIESYVNKVFELANIEAVVMTNDILDPQEQAVWTARGTGVPPVRRSRAGRPCHNLSMIAGSHDPRFLAAMRIDGLLNDWPAASGILKQRGYRVQKRLAAPTFKEVRRFLADQADLMSPVYLAASLPPEFVYPEESDRGLLLEECILPFARERRLPFALMIGVRRQVNPALRLAGDGVGRADLTAVRHLCQRNPLNKFLVTVLSRENQHELCVIARKFPNLMVFGCWWFVNIPSAIAEITAERFELLGTRFIPQHSDARVLEQVIYKWAHSRRIIADVLTHTYSALLDSGWCLTPADIHRDVEALFSGNFKSFADLPS